MRWKWIIGAVALLTGVVVAAVYITLSGYDFNSLKPQIVRATREMTGRDLTMGDIDLKIGFAPLLIAEDVGFQNAPWGSRPEMARIRRIEVQVALLPLIRGIIEIRRFALLEPDILIETDKSGKTNLALKSLLEETLPKSEKTDTPPDTPALPAIAFKDLRIFDGKLTYRTHTGHIPFTVFINTLQAGTASEQHPIRLTLKGTFNDSAVDLSGTVGTLMELIDPGKSWPVSLRIAGAGTVLSLDGTVDDPLERRGVLIRFNARGKDAAHLASFVGEPIPLKGPFHVSGQLIDPSPDIYTFSEVRAALGDNDIAGSISIDLSGKRPHLSAVLSSKKLDLRPLMRKSPGRKKGASAKDPASGRDRIFSKKPLQMRIPESFDAKLEIRGRRLLLPGLALGNLAADMKLNNGRLHVAPLTAVIGDGALNGRIEMAASQRSVNMMARITVREMDLDRLPEQLKIREILDGKLNVDLDLRSRGKSIAAMMAALNGNTRVEMNNGRINTATIDLIGGDLGSGIFYLINPFKEKADYTQIRCFVSLFDIRDGLAKSTALVLSTDRVHLVGKGEIDLKTEKLDMQFIPVPRKGVGGISMSLGELTNPFKLGGTLGDPSLAVDSTQTALTLGKAAGGFLLFGPFGIAAALLDTSSGDENPCLTAIAAAEKGVKVSKEKPAEKKETSTKVVDKAKKKIKSFGNKLKGLFGK